MNDAIVVEDVGRDDQTGRAIDQGRVEVDATRGDLEAVSIFRYAVDSERDWGKCVQTMLDVRRAIVSNLVAVCVELIDVVHCDGDDIITICQPHLARLSKHIHLYATWIQCSRRWRWRW